MFAPTSRPRLPIVLALALPLVAAERTGDLAGVPAPATTLGTIQATLDGQPRTWYVVAGQASDGPYAAGVWLERSDGGHIISLSGLDVEDPPIQTFSRGGGDASRMSMGAYDGSAMTMGVTVHLDALPLRISLPDDEGQGTVIFLPVVDVSDTSGMLVMRSGRLEVEEAAITGGKARLRGTFSGTLAPMQGGDTMEVTDGRFEVEGLPNVKDVQPGGP